MQWQGVYNEVEYECNINEIQAMCNNRIFNSEKYYATENSSNFQLFPKLKKTLKGIYLISGMKSR